MITYKQWIGLDVGDGWVIQRCDGQIELLQRLFNHLASNHDHHDRLCDDGSQ